MCASAEKLEAHFKCFIEKKISIMVILFVFTLFFVAIAELDFVLSAKPKSIVSNFKPKFLFSGKYSCRKNELDFEQKMDNFDIDKVSKRGKIRKTNFEENKCMLRFISDGNYYLWAIT